MRIGFGVVRVLMALLTLGAIIAQFATSVGFISGKGGDIGSYVVNFFSFFTIDANIGYVVVLLLGAFFAFSRTGDDPSWFTALRAVVVTYMATTGVVYNLLLRNIPLPQGQTVEWSNEVLHVVGPIYLVLDWFFAPGRAALRNRTLWWIVGFPIVWAIYTLIRGPFGIDPITRRSPWYPYPFLNPETSANGYLSVSFYVILIAAVILGVGFGVVWVSRRWPGGRRPPAPSELR
ncbi:Pr6Pr family membrane protein [Leifsonia poae]|uniref:Pr6Pr family membrane protein n=1 Tax=Leifsonia poae TaxID=110933 RepID=UPI001CC0C963|nr:Pr6Pr family membrane protein [Leifsonia poae]